MQLPVGIGHEIKGRDLILTGKKHLQVKLQRLEKARIWVFGSLVHRINSL